MEHDALLNPVSNSLAGVVDWSRHLPVIYDFWSSILLGTVHYHDRFFPKHLPLPINAKHSQRWLELFGATVVELFSGPKAIEVNRRALHMATMFEFSLRKHDPLSLGQVSGLDT